MVNVAQIKELNSVEPSEFEKEKGLQDIDFKKHARLVEDLRFHVIKRLLQKKFPDKRICVYHLNRGAVCPEGVMAGEVPENYQAIYSKPSNGNIGLSKVFEVEFNKVKGMSPEELFNYVNLGETNPPDPDLFMTVNSQLIVVLQSNKTLVFIKQDLLDKFVDENKFMLNIPFTVEAEHFTSRGQKRMFNLIKAGEKVELIEEFDDAKKEAEEISGWLKKKLEGNDERFNTAIKLVINEHPEVLSEEELEPVINVLIKLFQ